MSCSGSEELDLLLDEYSYSEVEIYIEQTKLRKKALQKGLHKDLTYAIGVTIKVVMNTLDECIEEVAEEFYPNDVNCGGEVRDHLMRNRDMVAKKLLQRLK